MGGVGMSTYLGLIGRRRGGGLFEAGRLLTFSAFRVGAYSRWALIPGWALIRINTVYIYIYLSGVDKRYLQKFQVRFNNLTLEEVNEKQLKVAS